MEPREELDALRADVMRKAPPGTNGDESRDLPLPATHVLAPDGVVALAGGELDCFQRLASAPIVVALRLGVAGVG